MKTFMLLALLCGVAGIAGCSSPEALVTASPSAETTAPVETPVSTEQPSAAHPTVQATAETPKEMSVVSSGIVDGIMDPAYGQNGTVKKNGIPTLSIPLEIRDAPAGTVCYAIYMDDPDAEPVCGYVYVHWTMVNVKDTVIPEGFSTAAGDKAIQGKTDFGKIGYGGPMPPDKDHTYIIRVYALDAELDLKSGFTKKQFTAAIEGHVIQTAVLEGLYRK